MNIRSIEFTNLLNPIQKIKLFLCAFCLLGTAELFNIRKQSNQLFRTMP